MKYLIAIFGLIAASWATQPATQTCLDNISDCFYKAGVISLPDVVIQININMVGFVVTFSVDLDCAIIGALVSVGTELFYNETTSNGVVTAEIGIGVLINSNFDLNSTVSVKILGLIQTGIGVCVITFIDASIIINLNVTFDAGNATNCKITELIFTKSGCSISNSGNSNIDATATNYKDYICNETFNNARNAIQNVLINCID
ncbi:uncharacterized protein [Onthophagus taurus]|uniref:uncharacterized protein n=1 Tax=Onthophagus taurus TaxID=166361 RepID=UPI0039BECD30